MVFSKARYLPLKEYYGATPGEEVASTMSREAVNMDVIKTSLIIAIGVTFYYLLLQWPTESVTKEIVGQDASYKNNINDSESSLTEPLATFSDTDVNEEEEEDFEGRYFDIENKDLALKIDSKTGRFVYSELKNITKEKGGIAPFEIFGKTTSPDSFKDNLYFANSGFYVQGEGYLNPNFSESSRNITDNGEIEYQFLGTTERFDFIRKVRFSSTGYKISVVDSVLSKSNEQLQLTPYVVIERDGSPVEEGGLMYTYLGPVFSSTNDTYEKYDFEDIKEAPYQNRSFGGWVALIQHYFLSAWVPNQSSEYLYQARYSNRSERFSLGYTSRENAVNYGDSISTENVLFVGPKLPGQLSEIEENLDLTVDYGFLWWLGKPMYWFLELGNKIFNNWGMAIIFLTVVLKIITWPLSAKAYVSMGKMRELAPKMQQLQEKHGDNRQAMSQEMMQMYQKEGVNPLGGCLPMLAQLPFFLAFYWVLLETVELRHSPFFLWIDDLSAMDPYFILPILNGAGMYLSQKLTPTPPNADPMQAQMMKIFPLVFAVIFAWFPSGLVLYWLVNMVIQIFQQWWYSRKALAN